MRIDRSYRDDQIRPHHFEKMARACEYPSPQLYETIGEYLDKIPTLAKKLRVELYKNDLKHPILKTLQTSLEERCRVLSKKFKSISVKNK